MSMLVFVWLILIRSPLLDYYYAEAVNQYHLFRSGLESLGIPVRILDSTAAAHDLSLQYASQYQLESFDALHFAISQVNNCDYFATLDGDFVHGAFITNPVHARILKIA
jgi:predicted nucleic acid-binding protein